MSIVAAWEKRVRGKFPLDAAREALAIAAELDLPIVVKFDGRVIACSPGFDPAKPHMVTVVEHAR